MYKFSVKEISLNSQNEPFSLIPKPINIIIGPNNSGKSRILKELRDYLLGDFNNLKIINNLSFDYPSDLSDLNQSYNLSKKISKDSNGNWFMRVYTNKPHSELNMNSSLESYYARNFNSYGGKWENHYEDVIKRKDNQEFFENLGSLFFNYIGTEERLTICKTQKNYGMDSGSLNYLSSYKFNNELLDSLQSNIKKLFKKDIYLDTHTLGERIAFRVGTDFDYIRTASQPSQEDVLRLFNESKLDDQGDGLKSYVSTFLSLNYSEGDVLLIDEPEAFLHPPLARQLGELIGRTHNDKQIFVATHSVEVLKGVLSQNTNVNIIRITQPTPGVNEIQLVDNDLLQTILTTPLLRVSRVMEGLFCNKVVITESEADELVYQELAEKLFPQSGLYFAHAQNKQTLVDIAKLYQKIGIKFEMITDFDIIRIPSEFQKFLDLMPLTDRDKQRYLSYSNKLREVVNTSVDTDGKTEDEIKSAQKLARDKVYHECGLAYFSDFSDKIKTAFELFSKHHLHILESGELETILAPYGVNYIADKKVWIELAMNKMQEMTANSVPKDSQIYKMILRIINN